MTTKREENIDAKSERTEDPYQHKEAYFRQLFEGSPDAIVMADPRGEVLEANASFERIFQYSPEEAKGRLINELVAPPHLAGEADELSEEPERRGRTKRCSEEAQGRRAHRYVRPGIPDRDRWRHRRVLWNLSRHHRTKANGRDP